MGEMGSGSLGKFMNRVVTFRDERDWRQFHKPKDMALSLMLEAAELGEVFQWMSDQETEQAMDHLRERIGNELADVLYWVLLIAHDCRVDLAEACEKKMVENERKYPVDRAKGSKKKYTEL